MIDLEKTAKNAFENFDPEVNSSVWSRIEQSLPNAPVSGDGISGSGSVTKGMLKALKGKIVVGVGSVITGAAIVTAIILNSSQQNGTSEITNSSIENTPQYDKPTEQIEATNQNDNKPETGIIAPVQINAEIKAEDASLKDETNLPGNKDETRKAEGMNVEKEVLTDTKAKTQNPITEEAKGNEENTKAGNSTIRETANPIHATNVVSTPLAVIMNTQIGFAPLKVVALLNNESAKADWVFEDNKATLSSNIASCTYTKAGEYKLTCTSGATVIEKTIAVIGTISTAFTPNGDGTNDEFYIESEQLEELNVKIFNRAGKQVYEITQPGQRWNGKDNNGNDLNAGIYFYDIFSHSISGQPINQKGTINIFR